MPDAPESGRRLPVLQPQNPAGQPPIFQRVVIVGLGLIGGSIALKAREVWPTSLVIAVDNKDVLETAMRLYAIDVEPDGNYQAVCDQLQAWQQAERLVYETV